MYGMMHTPALTSIKAWADNEIYYWRMLVVDFFPTFGSEEWGQAATFSIKSPAPTGLTPGVVCPATLEPQVEPCQAPVIRTAPAFIWNPVEGAAAYKVEMIVDGGDIHRLVRLSHL